MQKRVKRLQVTVRKLTGWEVTGEPFVLISSSDPLVISQKALLFRPPEMNHA
jgi:hypothetical protein